jgi:hypothetical protein
MLTPRDIKAGVPHVSVLSPTLYNFYINDTPQINGEVSGQIHAPAALPPLKEPQVPIG